MKKHTEKSEDQKNGDISPESQGPIQERETVPGTGETPGTSSPEDGGTAPQGETVGTEGDALKMAQEKIAELEKKNAELQDQYLRKAADFDNYRKRMIKEKQDAIDYANASLLGDLVQILDDFDRAMDSGGTHEPGTPASALAEGIAMIRGSFGSMLETKYGLAYYPAKGEAFDPSLHEAIAQAPSSEVTEPTVGEEFMKGYKLKDRVIRHAKVMVKMPAEKGE
jgi:molecular chaperone GrpE